MASNFLSARAATDPLRVFVKDTKSTFRLPADPKTPIILGTSSHEPPTSHILLYQPAADLSLPLPTPLPPPCCLPVCRWSVGPGTGVAPLRGFLLDRQASGASGDAVLFFGCRCRPPLLPPALPFKMDQHVEQRRVRSPELLPSSSYLSAWWMCRDGCRSDADYIYKDELEAFLDKGVLKV